MKLTAQKYLNDGELAHLKQLLTKFERSDFRNVTLIKMLYFTGARVSEVLDIRPNDLIDDGHRVFIRGLKNCRDRELPLESMLWCNLKSLCTYHGTGANDPIFPIGYDMARHVWLQYRPCKKKLHSLRHTRALEVYRKTLDVRLVQQMLGHTDIGTTMIYLDYTYNAEELRKAML